MRFRRRTTPADQPAAPARPTTGPARPPGHVSPVGRPAEPVTGKAPDGSGCSVDVADGRWVLLFLTSSCRSCRPLWDVLAAAPVGGSPADYVPGGGSPADYVPGGGSPADYVIVTPGPSTESRRAVAALAPAGLAVVMSSETWLAYSPGPAPWAVVVDGGVGVWEGPAPLDHAELAVLAFRPGRP